MRGVSGVSIWKDTPSLIISPPRGCNSEKRALWNECSTFEHMDKRLQQYKKNRIAGMNQYNAARAAGYSESMARTHSIDLERRVQTRISDAFERAGLTDKAIVRHALDGLEANKVISAVVVHRKTRATSLADGELFDANEKTNDFIEVPDWASRHKYLNTICELTERIKKRVEHSGKIDAGETKIIIVTQGDNARTPDRTPRIPAEVRV